MSKAKCLTVTPMTAVTLKLMNRNELLFKRDY
jgi:hypothetical protein